MADKDEYTTLKTQLTKEILKKQELSNKLTKLEDLIYDRENEYFNESAYGNIVKGFENFSKNTSNNNKKRIIYTEEDHIFSLASTQYIKSLMKRQGQSLKEDYDDYEDGVEPPDANGVAVHTPGSVGGTPGRKRKIRDE
ncbi:chromatin modification- protein eaf6 [Yamadazyma tenuis]